MFARSSPSFCLTSLPESRDRNNIERTNIECYPFTYICFVDIYFRLIYYVYFGSGSEIICKWYCPISSVLVQMYWKWATLVVSEGNVMCTCGSNRSIYLSWCLFSVSLLGFSFHANAVQTYTHTHITYYMYVCSQRVCESGKPGTIIHLSGCHQTINSHTWTDYATTKTIHIKHKNEIIFSLFFFFEQTNVPPVWRIPILRAPFASTL